MRVNKSYILIIGDDEALLIPPRYKNSENTAFVSDHNSMQSNPIIEEIVRHPSIPILILADVLAQEYRRDNLPRLGFSDRKKFMARKLEQIFSKLSESQQNQMSIALPIKKRAALFARLHDGGAVSLWLERLSRLSNKSGNIALLPLESAGMVKKLLPKTIKGWGILLSWQRTGGFRQIVTLDGELIFSRLTPQLPETTDAYDLAASVANDLNATRGYLARFGLTHDVPLHLAAIMPKSSHDTLTTASLPVQSLILISPHDAAKKLGLDFAPAIDDYAGDIVHALWLAKKKRPQALLKSMKTRLIQRNILIEHLGNVASKICWILAAFYFIWQGSVLFQQYKNYNKLYENVISSRQHIAQKRQELAPITGPLGRIRLALERKRLFSTPTPTPWELLQMVNSVIYPAAFFTKMHWMNNTLQFSLVFNGKDFAAQTQEFEKLKQQLALKLPDYIVKNIKGPDRESKGALTVDFVLQRSAK